MQKTVIAVGLSLLLAACSVNSTRTGNTVEQWTNYSHSVIDTSSLKGNQALAVFYKDPALQSQGVNIYVGGRYQASLLDGGYTTVPVCANRQLLSTSFVMDKQFGNRTDGVRYDLPAGSISYLKVGLDGRANLVLTQVPSSQAQAEMEGLKGQVNQTLSRVSNLDCSNVSDLVDATSATLTTVVHWELGQSSQKAMLPESKQRLAQLTRRVKEMGVNNITRIEVIGYTDPDGSQQYNAELSHKRAETISRVLKSSNINLPTHVIGMGATNLVVDNCSTLHPQKNHARRVCNQPNRRAEISVIGK